MSASPIKFADGNTTVRREGPGLGTQGARFQAVNQTANAADQPPPTFPSAWRGHCGATLGQQIVAEAQKDALIETLMRENGLLKRSRVWLEAWCIGLFVLAVMFFMCWRFKI